MDISRKELKNSQYTGKNRCWPCTVFNGLLALFISGILAVETWKLGAGFILIASTTIWSQGYLVPGTPTLTKRYFPDWVLRLFGKTIDADPSGLSAYSDVESSEVGVESILSGEGIIRSCDGGEDLCLSDQFKTRWVNELQGVSSVDEVDIQELVGTGGIKVGMREAGNSVVIRSGSELLGRWPSEAALIADATAASVCASETSVWDTLSISQRGQLLTGLRVFIPECPTTGGTVSLDNEVVESCCSEEEVAVVSCADTGERLVEQPVE